MPRLSLSHDLLDRRAFCDPAGGEQSLKKSRARSAIVVVCRDQHNRLFVVDSWADRVKTEDIIERVFAMNDDWHPFTFGVDASAQQSLFVDSTNQIAALRGKRIHLVGVKMPTHQKKIYRIRTTLQPVLAQRRLFVSTKLVELSTELASFPTGETMDLVDALAACIDLFPALPTESMARDAMQDYEDFLREQGLPDAEVRARMKVEFGSQGDPYGRERR